MRLSEIERLRWEHVDLEKRRLRFPGAKTKKVRSVPLLSGTAKMLAKMFQQGELVFPGFGDRQARVTAWRKAAVALGAGDLQMRYTRTTFARNATNIGIPMQRVMQAMGHTTVSVHMGYNTADESDLDLIRKLYDGN